MNGIEFYGEIGIISVYYSVLLSRSVCEHIKIARYKKRREANVAKTLASRLIDCKTKDGLFLPFTSKSISLYKSSHLCVGQTYGM